jgi:hypothetical protein
MGIPCRRARFSWGSEDSPLCGGFVRGELRVKMHAQAVLRPQRLFFFFFPPQAFGAASRKDDVCAIVDRLDEGSRVRKVSNETCCVAPTARVGSEG